MAPPCKRYRKVYTWQVSSIKDIINIAEFALAPPYWRIGMENHFCDYFIIIIENVEHAILYIFCSLCFFVRSIVS
jgi:hypothetical protein